MLYDGYRQRARCIASLSEKPAGVHFVVVVGVVERMMYMRVFDGNGHLKNARTAKTKHGLIRLSKEDFFLRFFSFSFFSFFYSFLKNTLEL